MAPRRWLHTSGVAAQAKGGKKAGGGAGAAAAPVEEKYDLKRQIPVNLSKEGPEPEYRPDAEYPPWLFALLEDQPTLDDHVMRGVEKVPADRMKRVIRLASKKAIKEGNDTRRKE